MGHVQVREVELAALMVIPRFPVLPQVGTDTKYEPLGRRKIATPRLPVGDERLVVVEATLTSAFATGRLGVPPPGSCGPPAWITVTLSVPIAPLGELPADTERPQPAQMSARAARAAAQPVAGSFFPATGVTPMVFTVGRLPLGQEWALLN